MDGNHMDGNHMDGNHMDGNCEGLFIDTSVIEIKSDCHELPAIAGIEGGVICTGFIDVEKVLRRVTCHGDVTHYFLEKKLPFQILLIAIDTQEAFPDGEDEAEGE